MVSALASPEADTACNTARKLRWHSGFLTETSAERAPWCPAAPAISNQRRPASRLPGRVQSRVPSFTWATLLPATAAR